MSLSDRFSDIGDTYPGSRMPRRQIAQEIAARDAEEAEDRWDAKPRQYKVNGVLTDFFTIGHLGKALGKKPVTLRMWESRGWLPHATFRAPAKKGVGQRLYTREQVEGVLQIAIEEDVLSGRKPFAETRFPGRVLDLFLRLEGQQ